MNDDLISRGDAKTVAALIAFASIDRKMTCGEISAMVNSIPSAQQWIPCGERLPETAQDVLITIKDTDEEAAERVRVSTGYLVHGEWFEIIGYCKLVNPCAWMPLPEPYNEKKETENEN